MEKINIAELLKDCPEGMELDCAIFENVTFEEVITARGFDDKKRVRIILSTHYSDGTKDEISLTEFGTYTDDETAKCVIFPKGKTTWKGFHILFKDGDVVTEDGGWIGITVGGRKGRFIPTYCVLKSCGEFEAYLGKKDKWYFERLATEEEKQKLFDAIKANGYRWNAETKTLEKLPKFKVGNRIKSKEPKPIINTITQVCENHYELDDGGILLLNSQDKRELVPNKFDITTLEPFESKVLARDYDYQKWVPTFWGKRLEDDSNCRYLTINGCYKYCIPYNEETKHLLGTTNDCDDFYKTWE